MRFFSGSEHDGDKFINVTLCKHHFTMHCDAAYTLVRAGAGCSRWVWLSGGGDACSEPNTRVWQRQSCLIGVPVRAGLLTTSKVLSKLYASTSKHYRKHSCTENTLQKYTRVHLMLALSRSGEGRES